MPSVEIYNMSELSSIIAAKEKEIELNSKRKSTITNQLSKLDEDYANNLLSANEYDSKKKELNKAMKEVDDRLETFSKALNAYKKIEELDNKSKQPEAKEDEKVVEPIQASYKSYIESRESEKTLEAIVDELEKEDTPLEEYNTERFEELKELDNDKDMKLPLSNYRAPGDIRLLADTSNDVELTKNAHDNYIHYAVFTPLDKYYNVSKINTAIGYNKDNGWEFNLANIDLIKEKSPVIYDYLIKLPGLANEIDLATKLGVAEWFDDTKKQALESLNKESKSNVNVELIKKALNTHNEDDIAKAIADIGSHPDNRYASDINNALNDMMINYNNQTYQEYLEKEEAIKNISYNLQLLETQNNFVEDAYKINIDNVKKALETKDANDVMLAMSELEALSSTNPYSNKLFNDMQKVFFKNNNIVNNLSNTQDVAVSTKVDSAPVKSLGDNIKSNDVKDVVDSTLSNRVDDPALVKPVDDSIKSNDVKDVVDPTPVIDNTPPAGAKANIGKNFTFGQRREPHLDGKIEDNAQQNYGDLSPVMQELIKLSKNNVTSLKIDRVVGDYFYNYNLKLLFDNGYLLFAGTEKDGGNVVDRYIINYPKAVKYIIHNNLQNDKKYDNIATLSFDSVFARILSNSTSQTRVTPELIEATMKEFGDDIKCNGNIILEDFKNMGYIDAFGMIIQPTPYKDVNVDNSSLNQAINKFLNDDFKSRVDCVVRPGQKIDPALSILYQAGYLYLLNTGKKDDATTYTFIINYPKYATEIEKYNENLKKKNKAAYDANANTYEEYLKLVKEASANSIVGKLTQDVKWGDVVTPQALDNVNQAFDSNMKPNEMFDSLKKAKVLTNDNRFKVNPPINIFTELVDNKQAVVSLTPSDQGDSKLVLNNGEDLKYDPQKLIAMNILIPENNKKDNENTSPNYIVNYPKMYTTLKHALPADDPRHDILGSLNLDSIAAKLKTEVVWSEEITPDMIDGIANWFGVRVDANSVLEELKNRKIITQGNKYLLNEPAVKALRGRIPTRANVPTDILSLNVGDLKRLYADNLDGRVVRWAVDDPKVISMDNGLIKAAKKGEATVKLIVDGHVKGIWKVDVKQKDRDFDDESRNIGAASGINMSNAKSTNKYDDSKKAAIHDPMTNADMLTKFMAIKQVKNASQKIKEKTKKIRQSYEKMVNVPDIGPEANYFAQSIGASIYGMKSDAADRAIQDMVQNRTDSYLDNPGYSR